MKAVTQKKNQVHFKAIETPTAWLILAVAWKIVDSEIIYSRPKVVKIIPKEESAIDGNVGGIPSPFLLSGTSKTSKFEELILSPYSFTYSPERSGSITKYGARPPTFSSRI